MKKQFKKNVRISGLREKASPNAFYVCHGNFDHVICDLQCYVDMLLNPQDYAQD